MNQRKLLPLARLVAPVACLLTLLNYLLAMHSPPQSCAPLARTAALAYSAGALRWRTPLWRSAGALCSVAPLVRPAGVPHRCATPVRSVDALHKCAPLLCLAIALRLLALFRSRDLERAYSLVSVFTRSWERKLMSHMIVDRGGGEGSKAREKKRKEGKREKETERACERERRRR